MPFCMSISNSNCVLAALTALMWMLLYHLAHAPLSSTVSVKVTSVVLLSSTSIATAIDPFSPALVAARAKNSRALPRAIWKHDNQPSQDQAFDSKVSSNGDDCIGAKVVGGGVVGSYSDSGGSGH